MIRIPNRVHTVVLVWLVYFCFFSTAYMINPILILFAVSLGATSVLAGYIMESVTQYPSSPDYQLHYYQIKSEK